MATLTSEIDRRIGIDQLATQLGIEIAKDAGSYAIAYCPFHDDRKGGLGAKPNLSLWKSANRFRCFKCSAKGGPIALYAQVKRMSHKDAARDLARLLGIAKSPIARGKRPGMGKPAPKPTWIGEFAAWNDEQVRESSKCLLQTKQVLEHFLALRGLTKEFVERRKIGFVPRIKAYSIPVYGEDGKLAAVKFHSFTDRKRKYFARKSSAQVVYDVRFFDPQAKEAWVVEGEPDLWIAQRHGLNALCSMAGASSLPEVFGRMIDRLAGKRIVLVPHNDEAGKEAMAKLRLVLPEEDVHKVEWPPEFEKDLLDWVVVHRRKVEELPLVPYPFEAAAKFLEAKDAQTGELMSSSNPLFERVKCYFKANGRNTHRISNFVVRPKTLLQVKSSITLEENVSIRGDLEHQSGLVKEKIVFDPTAFQSKSKFSAAIKDTRFSWTGSDTDLQHLSEILTSRNLPIVRTADVIGFCDEKTFLGPGFAITGQGVAEESGVEYIPCGSIFEDEMELDTANAKPALSALHDHLFQLNDPSRIKALLGWFVACYYRTLIQKRIRYFPILTLFGESGSGKTSLSLLFWRLFGLRLTHPISASATHFAILRTFSTTNCVPMIVDELKWTLGREQIGFWQQTIRSSYGGESDMRGRADLSLAKFRHEAPLCLAGEMSIVKELAIAERTIQLTLARRDLSAQAKQAYGRLLRAPLSAFMPEFVRWSLASDRAKFNEHWLKARAMIATYKLPPGFSDRTRDNLTVIVFGLFAYSRFMRSQGFDVSFSWSVVREVLNSAVSHIELVQGRPRNAIDDLIEAFSLMAQSGRLKRGTHFEFESSVYLWLHLASCLSEFARWSREHDWDGEKLAAREYKNMIKNMVGHSYMESAGRVVYMPDVGSRWCVVVSLENLAESGLEVPAFVSADAGGQGTLYLEPGEEG